MSNDRNSGCTNESASFSIHCTQLLDSEGRLNPAADTKEIDRELLVSMYRHMKFNRLFDERAVALQRTGQLGTFASSLGQEAVSVGVACAMDSSDVFLPSFREQGGQLVRGVSPFELLTYWGGDEHGSNYAKATEDFPVCIPVASQYPHAVGVALSFKLRQLPRVAVVVGGDGSTSKGDFYEALNMAGAWQVPAVFIIDNNQWAISTPRRSQTHARTLAQKAIAAGIPGEQVDGNDVLAVHQVTKRAISHARSGQGATLIEALSYRMSDHTTADDATRYRNEEVVAKHWHQDPIARLKKYLVTEQAWSLDEEKSLQENCVALMDGAEEKFLERAQSPATDMVDYLYETLPLSLTPVRETLKATKDAVP